MTINLCNIRFLSFVLGIFLGGEFFHFITAPKRKSDSADVFMDYDVTTVLA